MYRSRSEAFRLQKQRQRRKIRKLLLLNLSMIFLIVILAVFLWQRSDGINALPTQHPSGSGANGPQAEGSSGPPSGQAEEELGGAVDEPSGESEAPAAEAETEDEPIKLTFTGDVLLSGKIDKLMREHGYDYPYRYVAPIFQQDDLTVVNLETPVTERGTPAVDKMFVFKSSPKAIPALAEAGVDAVNLANNHILDQGVEGLFDTIDALDEADIKHVGAGKDADSAFRPVYFERKGMKIALLGFSRVVPEVSWKASAKRPGVAETYDSTRAVEAIRAAKEEADIVLVMVHWGEEKKDLPNKFQKTLAHQYIDAGADLIIGSHPHVLQGFEQYKGKWIAYSLGNFIFTKSSHPKTWETAIMHAECSKDGNISLRLTPYHAELGQAVPMDEETGKALLRRVSDISFGAKVRDDGTIVALSDSGR
ncbi:hypothetical protein PAE9249_00078 [Paenibacillus sp. CECT 9249]|uniref:CapA family protein n=1 Tax=Paenibacillus sp. CECT 9249 TaxID=2845385 RepID=UPI001E492E12|nr:CapA family protein [Paenibacillus sp. CECT 9249]CAH0117618.1 hypothetical protein PAE9249_00078 [Paenibacillus sp. CECT 9249]